MASYVSGASASANTAQGSDSQYSQYYSPTRTSRGDVRDEGEGRFHTTDNEHLVLSNDCLGDGTPHCGYSHNHSRRGRDRHCKRAPRLYEDPVPANIMVPTLSLEQLLEETSVSRGPYRRQYGEGRGTALGGVLRALSRGPDHRAALHGGLLLPRRAVRAVRLHAPHRQSDARTLRARGRARGRRPRGRDVGEQRRLLPAVPKARARGHARGGDERVQLPRARQRGHLRGQPALGRGDAAAALPSDGLLPLSVHAQDPRAAARGPGRLHPPQHKKNLQLCARAHAHSLRVVTP
ncbi:NF-kappa B inhibitor [Orf virus]